VGTAAKRKGTAMKSGRVDLVLAALADPLRRRVVDVLRAGPRSAGELSRLVRATAPAMSRHLRVLKSCGLVTEKHPAHDARVRIYGLRPGPLGALKTWLDP
jgi:DNA-binding transcriptional ArsR family regulator